MNGRMENHWDVRDAMVSGINLMLRVNEVGIPYICDLGEVPLPL